MASVTYGKCYLWQMYYGKCNYGKNIYGKNIMANETEPRRYQIQLLILCSKCHTVTEAQLSISYLHRSQMMGTIRPVYINTGFQCYVHKDTSLAIHQAIIDPKLKILPDYKNRAADILSHSKQYRIPLQNLLHLILYILYILQVNMN